jgi:glycosyltransferase involved in cell wall biosynthesis
MKLRVVHLIAGDSNGGAARGALNLHQQLLIYGVDSVALLSGKLHHNIPNTYSYSPSVCQSFLYRIKQLLIKILLRILYPRRKNIYFSTGLNGLDVSKSTLVKSADVVHMHFVSNFLSIFSISMLRKPLIITFRDMWFFTGGCHIAYNCSQYIDVCGTCPALGSDYSRDLSYFLLLAKQKYFPNSAKIVFISEWLKNRFLESSLYRSLAGLDYTVIHNTIDESSFSLSSRASSDLFERFCIKNIERVFLCGAINLLDPWKGFDILCDSILKLPSEIYNGITLGVFGAGECPKLACLPVRVVKFGTLTHDELLFAYQHSYAFIQSSTYEAFGKTVAEAMSCGLPVVAFSGTGSSEIIEDGISGFLADLPTPYSLAKAVEKVYLLDESSYHAMCLSAARRIQDQFGAKRAVSSYLELYKSSISSSGSVF